MKLLVDGDVLVYMIGFGSDKEDLSLEENYARMYKFIEDLKKNTCASDVEIYLTSDSKDNYRVKLYPEYKANRKSGHKPVFYDEIRNHLVTKYNAILVKGQEADDELGLNQTDDTVICTIDKDLMMVSGWHYNWNKPKEGLVYQTPREGFRMFCMQCLTGDSVDNIPGIFKLSGSKATKKIKEPLYECDHRHEMWAYVSQVYSDLGIGEELLLVSQLLWIKHTYMLLPWQLDFNQEVTDAG